MRREGFLGILFALLVVSALAILSCTPSIESEPADTDAAPAADNTSADTGGPPPLVVDMNTPLLLDEPTEEEVAAANTEAAVENTACFVCHANYMTEFLAGYHAGVNIGCVHCHGESTAHRNDENNTTPPEIMYPAEKIDAYCQGCHSTAHDIPPRMIIARWLERREKEAKSRAEGVPPSNRGQDARDTIQSSCAGCHKEDDVPPAKVVARWKERGLDKATIYPGKIVCTDCHGDHRIRVRTVIWDKTSGKLLSTNKGE